MIQFVEGPLGSGKSYYAVNYVAPLITYNKLYDQYTLASDVLIISDIEGFATKMIEKEVNGKMTFVPTQIPKIGWNLKGPNCLGDPKENIKGKFTVDTFFTIANFENIMSVTKKNHIILIIDEAHRLFPAGWKNAAIYDFFAFSRHLGIDIILMTQGIKSLTTSFNPLLEFIVKAKPRTKQLMGSLTYDFVDLHGKYLYSQPLVKRAAVYNLYASNRVEEKNKPKSALLYWIVIAVTIFILAGVIFKSVIAGVKQKPKVLMNQSSVVVPPKPPVVASAAVAVQRPMSSVAVAPVVAVAAVPFVAPVVADLPRVLGYVGYVNGKNVKYLLSSGQTVICKRQLNIGDIYIR